MAVEIGAILDIVRSGYDASDKLIAHAAQALAVRTELINHAITKNQPVDLAIISKQAAEIIKKEASEVEKTTVDKVKEKASALEAVAAIGLLLRGALELAELASTPNPATAAMLTVMPPPVVIGLYAIVAVVNLAKVGFEAASLVSQQSKIMFGNLNEVEKKEAVQHRNKILMNLGQSALAIAASCTMIAAAFFAPGSTNLLGASFLAASVALTGARLLYGSVKGASETVKEISQKDSVDNIHSNALAHSHQHTAQHEEKKERTENLGKALGAYFTALTIVYTERLAAVFSNPRPAAPTQASIAQPDPFAHQMVADKPQASPPELVTKNTVITEPKGPRIDCATEKSAVARVSEATAGLEEKTKLR